MGDSMLVYSEKMKRISRSRLGQGSSSSVSSGESSHTEKNNDSRQCPGTKLGHRLRSLSDASSHASIRGRHLLTKKVSWDASCVNNCNAWTQLLSDSQDDHAQLGGAPESPDRKQQQQQHKKRGLTVAPRLDVLPRNPKRELDDCNILPGMKCKYPQQNVVKVDKIVESALAFDQNEHVQKAVSGRRGPFCQVREEEWGCAHQSGETFRKSNPVESELHCEQSEIGSLDAGCVFPLGTSPECEGLSDRIPRPPRRLNPLRQRLGSSSAPTSPAESSDEEEHYRKRTQSLSLPSSPVKSVLKKQSFTRRRQKHVRNLKSVSFKSPDTIRVISRCSEDDLEEISGDGQSQSTIVVIRDY